MDAHFAAVQTMAVLIFLPSSVSSKLDRQSHQLLWQAVAKNFIHIPFCRPNARWLSLLDDCHHELRNPCATRPCPLEQNSGDATRFYFVANGRTALLHKDGAQLIVPAILKVVSRSLFIVLSYYVTPMTVLRASR